MAWDQWIGRSETRRDHLTQAATDRFRATIDSDAAGPDAEQAIHWCLCLPDAPTEALGADGHPLRDTSPDSFMPPVPLPRRMWAASAMHFHEPIPIGAAVERQSSIARITEKAGQSGALIFVDVAHRIFADDRLAVEEDQTIVFRDAAAKQAPPPAPKRGADTAPDLSAWQWHRRVTPSQAMLFRYSAMTFNSHRIHYDLPYAVEVESYPALVVHGPLTATLLLDLARRHIGSNRLRHFSMRAISPAFAGDPLYLVGRPVAQGWELSAIGPDGRVIMAATAA